MPIQKISARQFADQIRQGILNRDATFEVTVGEIPDLVIEPQARTFEQQNDRVRQLSLITSLVDPAVFEGQFEVDLQGIVFNEGLTRSNGSQATNNIIYSRSAAPASDIRIQRGFPIGTEPDESTGRAITFVTTEERVMTASAAASFFNIQTQRYELTIPVVAVVEGASGNVGALRINRPLRPLLGFDSVTNPQATTGGRDRETNQQLIDRYLIAILGRRLATSTGVRKIILDDFPDVSDVLVVSGADPLLTRADTDPGAVDAYVVGDQIVEAVENPLFFGAGQLVSVQLPPLRTVISVQDLATGTTYIENTDYQVVFDTSDNAKSIRAAEGIRFLFTATNPLPALGAPVTITYSYNNLIRRLQVSLGTDDFEVNGRDLLVKARTDVPITLTANLRVSSGFNTGNVQTAVINAILNFFRTQLGLGKPVEQSDINAAVRQVSGVDNFIFTRLTRSTVPSGVTDITIAGNERATLDNADLTVSLI